jgi:hypothetical protein
MRMKLFSGLVLLFVAFLFCEKASACSTEPKWKEFMDNGKFEDALKHATKNSDKFTRDFSPFCAAYFRAESNYKLGKVVAASELMRDAVRASPGAYTRNPVEWHKFLHWSMEVAESEIAAGRLDSAETIMAIAANHDEGPQALGKCLDYPIENKSPYHGARMIELISGIDIKKGNFARVLELLEIIPTKQRTDEMNNNLAIAKGKITKASDDAIAEAKQKEIQAAKDAEARKIADKQREEALAKQKIIDANNAEKQKQQQEAANKQAEIDRKLRTVRIFDFGNTSVKINDSATALTNAETRTWLENSGLAFSENGEELYFRSPAGDFYQVWNVAKKEKVSEISSAEAATTQKGREIIAAFPNVFYRADTNANSKIWLSADTNVSFDSNNKFTISGGQNQTAKTFKLEFRKGYEEAGFFTGINNFLGKSEIVNTKYQLYLQKTSNRLFIVAIADQKYKSGNEIRSFPFCGVFDFNLNTNALNRLSDRLLCAESDDRYTTDKFYFSNNFLLHYWGEEDGKVYFRQTDLTTATWENLKYLRDARNKNYIQDSVKDRTKAWEVIQHIGTDLNGVTYIVDPRNNHLKITGFDKLDKSKYWEIGLILNSGNKKNYVHFDEERSTFVNQQKHDEIMNVTAVSPSGKYFAYLSLSNRSGAGNYASIMLYNTDEKDRVYSLNDQTKNQPYIAKGYVTDKESEDIEIVWKKQTEAAKLQNQANLKPQIEAVKVKIAEAENELNATYQRDFDLASQRKYSEILVGKEWVSSFTQSVKITYRKGQPGEFSGIVDFNLEEKLSFRIQGNLTEAVYEETLVMPGVKSNNAGEYFLKESGESGTGYGSSAYVSTTCKTLLSDFDGNRALTKPEFKFNNAVGDCSEPTGKDAFKFSGVFEKWANEYLGFLMGSKFGIGKTGANSPIRLVATGKNGQQLIFDYVYTDLQRQILTKLNKLQSELNRLQASFDSGK